MDILPSPPWSSFFANVNISKTNTLGFDGKLQVRSGLAEEWINQNHDGLAQKAGCPQEKLNEVFIGRIIHSVICKLFIWGPLPSNPPDIPRFFF